MRCVAPEENVSILILPKMVSLVIKEKAASRFVIRNDVGTLSLPEPQICFARCSKFALQNDYREILVEGTPS